MFEPSEHRPTEAIVDLNAIQHNVRLMLDQLTPEQKLYATVKANAYGHGAVPVAKAALEAGAKGLLVATVDEAIELRTNGLSQVPILVLGLTDPRGIAELLHYNITITVSDSEFFRLAYQQLEATNQLSLLDLYHLKFHLALDTGMGRIGLRSVAEVEQFIEDVQAFNWVEWEGAFTHFSTAGGGPQDYIEYQFEQWQQLIAVVPDTVPLKHFANTAMGMWHPYEPKSDIIRFGIGMYGIDPLDRPLAELPEFERQLQPALQLISEIIYTKKVPKGHSISYGATYTTTTDEWIATIPIGYADGWLRRYSVIEVLVGGVACPIVGRINMDQMMIRLPEALPIGTPVTLIGKDGHLENHASELARKVDTISYEIFCGISNRVPRIYLKD